MRFFDSPWCPIFLGTTTVVMLIISVSQPALTKSAHRFSKNHFVESEEWSAPSPEEIPTDSTGDQIRYGRSLITNTAFYLGPRGIIAPLTNGMNCQNCHLHAGTRNFANPFSAISSMYPVYRHRSGRTESVEFRVNDCMQRSLNGEPLDSNSAEMRAMVAYLRWVSNGVPRGVKPGGAGVEELPFLARAADPANGRTIYQNICSRCHGADGQGVAHADGSGYLYPPLWGDHSYNVSAGMYRLSRLAGFVKNNMPFGVSRGASMLTNEQAWDVAAFVLSQPRPTIFFKDDWPDISKKPPDYPYGPFSDGLSAVRHKFGPFTVQQ